MTLRDARAVSTLCFPSIKRYSSVVSPSNSPQNMATTDIRTALKRLTEVAEATAQSVNVGIMDDAIAAADAALNAEPEECPVKKHCAEMLQLWDAECEMDNAMEHLRGLLSVPKQPTEIQP